MTSPRERPNRRQQHAAATRREILQAARGLFATRGYRATRIADIAVAAGVSVQTIYDRVGSKKALVTALNDLIDEEGDVGELASTIGTSDDPLAVLSVSPAICRRILERCGDIVRASLTATAAEPDLAELLSEGRRRHRAGASSTAHRLEALRALRIGIAVDHAADTIAALTDPAFGVLLLDDYGWSFDKFEAWANHTLRMAVLHNPT